MFWTRKKDDLCGKIPAPSKQSGNSATNREEHTFLYQGAGNPPVENKATPVSPLSPPGVEAEKTKTWTRACAGARKQWIFTVIDGLDRGRQYIGNTKEIKIGRRPENHIQLKDPKVSRFHAVVRWKGQDPVLKDLHSTNGTRINGREVKEERLLLPGDLIALGETVIRVGVQKG